MSDDVLYASTLNLVALRISSQERELNLSNMSIQFATFIDGPNQALVRREKEGHHGHNVVSAKEQTLSRAVSGCVHEKMSDSFEVCFVGQIKVVRCHF